MKGCIIETIGSADHSAEMMTFAQEDHGEKEQKGGGFGNRRGDKESRK